MATLQPSRYSAAALLVGAMYIGYRSDETPDICDIYLLLGTLMTNSQPTYVDLFLTSVSHLHCFCNMTHMIFSAVLVNIVNVKHTSGTK